MRVRAKITLRNDVMISSRKKRGWSQRALASKADVTLRVIQDLEMMNYSQATYSSAPIIESAIKVSVLLEVDLDDIYDSQFSKDPIPSSITIVRDINPSHLISDSRHILSSPDEIAELNEEKDTLREAMSSLNGRDQKVISLYSGLEKGPDTFFGIGESIGISPERTRQILLNAMFKLRKKMLLMSNSDPVRAEEIRNNTYRYTDTRVLK